MWTIHQCTKMWWAFAPWVWTPDPSCSSLLTSHYQSSLTTTSFLTHSPKPLIFTVVYSLCHQTISTRQGINSSLRLWQITNIHRLKLAGWPVEAHVSPWRCSLRWCCNWRNHLQMVSLYSWDPTERASDSFFPGFVEQGLCMLLSHYLIARPLYECPGLWDLWQYCVVHFLGKCDKG